MGEYKKGKIQLMVIIALLLSVSIITILFTNMWTGTGDISKQLIRLSLTIALCYFLYKGKKWAKNITVFLLGISVLFGMLVILIFLTNPFLVIVMLIYTSVYVACLIMLSASKHINEYFIQKNTIEIEYQ